MKLKDYAVEMQELAKQFPDAEVLVRNEDDVCRPIVKFNNVFGEYFPHQQRFDFGAEVDQINAICIN